MTVATPEDVVARWPAGIPAAEEPTIQTALDDAEVVIRARYPDLDALIEWRGRHAIAALRLVESRIVIRALAAPGPRGVQRQQIGDYAVTYREVTTEDFTDADWALLDAALGVVGAGLVSVPTVRADREALDEAGWVDGSIQVNDLWPEEVP